MNSSGFGEAERRSIVNKIQLKKEEINTIWNTIKFFNVDELKAKWNDPIGKRFVDLILGCELYVKQIESNLDVLKKCVSNYDVNTGKSSVFLGEDNFDTSDLDELEEFGDYASDN